jgi:hypothetical protein
MRLAGLSAWAVCSLSTFTYAEPPSELPFYDVEKICRQQSALVGGGDFMHKACLDQEQRSYDELKKDWEGLDKKVKATCREMARVAYPSYFMLNACVAQELKAKEELSNFKFKR